MSESMLGLRVPSFCPICGMLMRGSKATTSYYDHGCCVLCFIEWVEGREERWTGGWRPDVEAVEKMKSRYDCMFS
jgi:hypothetical protein